jgi:hypothetical protein
LAERRRFGRRRGRGRRVVPPFAHRHASDISRV